MVLVDGRGTPPGAYLDSANPSEISLLEATRRSVSVHRTHRAGQPRCYPDRLIADRGYDSNGVREWLAVLGIQPILPKRSNNTKATRQDGRKLRRYRRRWIVERTNAWLGNFRGLLVRHARLLEAYRGFFYIARPLITLRVVLK